MAHRTINALIDASCGKHGPRPSLGMAFQPSLSYAQLCGKVLAMAAYLDSQGVKPGDRVAILAENSPYWGIAYLATVRLGAVTVPILPDFLESDVHHILRDAGVKLLFTTGGQIYKVVEVKDTALKTIVALDDFHAREFPRQVTTFAAAMADGEVQVEGMRERLSTLAGQVRSEDTASIIYTSGTSGHSKAVILSHRNLCANLESVNGVITITPDWTFLSILPMSHTYEFTIGFLLPLDNGARVVYADARPTPTVIERICAKERPTVLCVVPLVMEKIYKKKILPAIEKKKVLHLAVQVGFLRRLIFRKAGKKLMEFFGGRLALVAIGGAPINHEVERFLLEAGFPYLVGYGLTEASPLVSGGPFHDPTIALGSAGKPVPGVTVTIGHPDPETGIGEIMARGPNVMTGYANNPELTAETIHEGGWLATGDLGFLDDQGNLHIVGRSKSVIVLSHGENIYPEAIEDRINSFYHVVESLVVQNGDRIEALVYLDYTIIDEENADRSQPEKRKIIQEILDKIKTTVNRELPAFSQLARVVEREEPFVKTATHKIKRYLYAR